MIPFRAVETADVHVRAGDGPNPLGGHILVAGR